MTWPTTILIDTVFIPLYVAAGLLNLANVVKHGRTRTVGFISLLLVSLLHLVGNILLVVEYHQHYSSINVTVWGYILQSIGLSFLVSASLAFYSRARTALQDEDAARRTVRLLKLLNLVNLAALVCVITGYTSTDFTDAEGHVLAKVQLPVQATVGAVLYVVLVLTIIVVSLVGLRHASSSETRVIRTALLVAAPLMLIRAAWAVYTTHSGSILVPKNIWLKLVLQYITEYAALAAMTALGFLISKLNQKPDIEQVSSYPKMSQSTPPHSLYQHQTAYGSQPAQ